MVMVSKKPLPETLVLGVGNVLFGDEGLGVHLASLLRHNHRFTPEPGSAVFEIGDGGTLGPHLIPLLSRFRRVLLLDCISAAGAAPGDVFCFDYEKIPANISRQGSAHEVEMHQTLAMMRMAGDIPQITVLAAVPAVISETTFELSPAAVAAATVMELKALEILAGWGIDHRRAAAATIGEIAAACCQGPNHAP